jgi:hypothetical protein
MKNLIYFLFSVMFLHSCSSTKKAMPTVYNDTNYLIKKIDKEKTWYIIYAERKDTLYKIVSKADNSINSNCKKIFVGQRYDFFLISHKDTAPIINGVKLAAVGYTGCYHFDGETTICLEPKRGIYDLFYTNDLKGACYLK